MIPFCLRLRVLTCCPLCALVNSASVLEHLLESLTLPACLIRSSQSGIKVFNSVCLTCGLSINAASSANGSGNVSLYILAVIERRAASLLDAYNTGCTRRRRCGCKASHSNENLHPPLTVSLCNPCVSNLAIALFTLSCVSELGRSQTKVVDVKASAHGLENFQFDNRPEKEFDQFQTRIIRL